MLYICENFLKEDECKELIKLYENNLNFCFQYRNTFTLPLIKLDKKNNLINLINDKVQNICEILFPDKKIKIDNSAIVQWPKDSYQSPHYDGDDVCAVVIYLNDDFIGGKTCFNINEKFKITPETGKCLIFSNSKYLHWVESVQTNVRYTLGYWFINI